MKPAAGYPGPLAYSSPEAVQTTGTVAIVGVVVVLCLGELLIWVETSRKDIKLWGIEITQPESDGIKSCRAIQAAFHDKKLGLENDRAATYRVMENDEASIDAFTKLQL